jgi:hypothetical protein
MDRRRFIQAFVGATAAAAVSGSALLTKAGIPEKKTGNVNIDYPLHWMSSNGNLCRLVKVRGTARSGDVCMWTGRPNEVSRYGGDWPISGVLWSDPSDGWGWLCISGRVPVRWF